MHFVITVKSLLLYRVNSYSGQLMCIPIKIFLAKKFSFILRLLHSLYIRSVFKLNYERLIVMFND